MNYGRGAEIARQEAAIHKVARGTEAIAKYNTFMIWIFEIFRINSKREKLRQSRILLNA